MVTNPFITELIRLLRFLSFSDDAVVLDAARSANALVKSNGYVWEEVLDDSLRYEDVPQKKKTPAREYEDPTWTFIFCRSFGKQYLQIEPEEEAILACMHVRFACGHELSELEREWLDKLFHRTLDAYP